MINFKAGALRPAGNGAWPTRFETANDLVRQTLAQHGLWTEGDAHAPPLPNPLKAGAGPARAWPNALRPSTRPVPMPDGAAFRSETFTGKTGARAYRHYVPASANDGIAGIVLMLHGCTQTPEDFAIGTKMNALAEAHRLVVIYPEQSRGANAQTCWNWFSKGDQRRDRGKPEILAGITRKVMAEHSVTAGRVFVAGLSAGAAMAVILGQTYPDVFAAVGAHSGLPFGAARDVPSAFAAMAGDIQGAQASTPANTPPSIIFHGSADRTVHPANGAEIARRAGNSTGAIAIETVTTGEAHGRGFRRTLTSYADGAVLSEYWVIDGLGHAWSGGDGAGSYADPAGPDASAEMIRFFLALPAAGGR